MLDKTTQYIYRNEEKYKASYSQSKTTGQIYFDVSVNAPTLNDLEEESKNAVEICIRVCNDHNSKIIKTEKKGA